jgi:hypothetical protein
MSISRSPARGTFQFDGYLKRKEADGEEPSPEYLEMFKTMEQRKNELEQDPTWRENNLEYDLRSTAWILDKTRSSDTYAQNLYAAICNNEFQKRDVFPILKGETCSYSWRYAGGIIADMRQEGDYIDWYCSGIGEGLGNGDVDRKKGYVSEGTVTEEIEQDLVTLGWNVVDSGEIED